MRVSLPRINLLRILHSIILIDLIFGGSGRLIMIGSLSLRTVLFAMAMILMAISFFEKKFAFREKSAVQVIIFILYIIANTLLIGDASFSMKFDFLSRYLYIALVFFYEIYFSSADRDHLIEQIRVFFERLTVILAAVTILIWIWSFRNAASAYQVIELSFFRPYVYGSFDFIGGSIPRIFMKSGIFVAIGLLFQLERFLTTHSSRLLIPIALCGLATIFTFTSGFYIATAVCIVLLLQHKKVLKKKSVIIAVMAIAVLGIVALRFGFIEIMKRRYTGDYSSSYRFIQLESILNEFSKKPILGHGFGHEFSTRYGQTIRATAYFEIAWGELLVDAGMIGFGLFVTIIFGTLRDMARVAKRTGNEGIYIFALGLVFICIESLTNPFINNSIGLTYFAICAGITNAKCSSIQPLNHE